MSITLAMHRAGYKWPEGMIPSKDKLAAGQIWVRGWVFHSPDSYTETIYSEALDGSRRWVITNALQRPNPFFDAEGRKWVKTEEKQVTGRVVFCGVYSFPAEKMR